MLSSLAAFEDVTSSGAALIGKHGLCRSVFSKIECSTLTKCVIMADSLSTWAAEMPGFQVWKDGIMVDSVDDADPKKLKQLVQAHDWGVPQKKRAAEAEAGAGERKKLRSEPTSSVAAEDEGAAAAKPTLAAVEAAEAAAGRTMAKSSSGQVDDAIESGRRVFVANLPYSANDAQIRKGFEKEGVVTAIEWLYHKDTHKFKGSGFLTFATTEQAAAAVRRNGALFGGRPMRLDLAVSTQAPSGTFVLVRNLPPEDWTEAAVRVLYEECGAILQITLPKKGKAALRFRAAEGAAAAVARDREERGGRIVRVLPTSEFGVEDGVGGKGGGDGGGKGGGKGGGVGRPRGGAGTGPPLATWRVEAAAAGGQGTGAVTGGGEGTSDEYLSSHARRGGPKERAAAAAAKPKATSAE